MHVNPKTRMDGRARADKLVAGRTLVGRPATRCRSSWITRACLLLIIASSQVQALELSATSKAFTAAAEPIKWSFGGWAPLEGQNKSTASRAAILGGATSPLPAPPSPAPATQATRANRTRAESLNESASNSNEQVQLAYPRAPETHQQSRYSMPAPSPIVREHLFAQQQGPRYAPEVGQEVPPMMAQRLNPHFRPPPFFEHQQQLMQQQQQRHQQQMAQHQHQMMRANQRPPHHHARPHPLPHPNPNRHQNQHQRPHPHPHPQAHHPHPQAYSRRPHHDQYPPMQSRPQQASFPHQMQTQQLVEQPSRSIPRYPGSPPSLHASPPPASYMKEHEQPIMFSESLPQDRIPMIEVSAGAPSGYSATNLSRPEQATHQLAMTQEEKASTAADPMHPSTLAAIEKDNLNYHNALQQVTGAIEQQQKEAQQSNNIQDIKQRQQYEQQRAAKSAAQTEADKANSKGYLTIPVAVETEGDKVLTADDINEIEKHVINVLPSLKTADKMVKLADTQLTLGDIKASAAAAAAREQPHPGQGLQTAHYEEHRSTMKQLEEELKQTSPPGYKATTGTLNQASTANAQHQPAPGPLNNQPQQHRQQPDEDQIEHQYYVASGPLQEAAQVEPEQLAEYNLIKNDLLNNFRYEPTRSGRPQTASTPMGPRQASSTTRAQHRPASVTRYFQQGPNRGTGQYNRNTGSGLTSTTRTMMGGRKVSDVMRPLIRTTPVPLTSPLHVPSVEPEKVDAIQLIAGRANDKQPMVVEAHQLINHTPDGGIDYNSGSPMLASHQQQQTMNQSMTNAPNYQQNQLQVEPHQYVAHDAQSDGNQGAIIEYVTVTDQALNNAIARQQGYELASQPETHSIYIGPEQQQQQQSPQRQPNPTYDASRNSQSPFLYDYTISTQQAGASSPMPPMTTNAVAYLTTQSQAPSESNNNRQAEPSLAWSPSIASEHQQHQLELTEHAGARQQVDMPSTAGYNFFVGHQEQQQQQQHVQQQPSQENNNQQDHRQPAEQQQDSYQQQPRSQKWRSKAGGSQPNPDAQYDGQIVRDNQEHQASADDISRQADNQANGEQQQSNNQYLEGGYGDRQIQQQGPQQTIELARLSMDPHSRSREEQSQQQQQQAEDSQDNPVDQAYQQQNQERYQEQQLTTPAAIQATDSGSSYMSTNSYVGGAQLNHQTPPDADYGQQSRFAQASGPQQYNYVKLDQDRQQNHLAKQQAQHQANLVDLLNSQQSYPTTTPMSVTTMTAIEQQQGVAQPNSPQQQEHHQEHQQGIPISDTNSYSVQEQSASSDNGPPSPDTMLINEAPVQMPISDQQSLIPDQHQDSINSFSSDDASSYKQGQHSQPPAVYQVYQAYYAPKDHKPLPGYVRLSLDEFNELFRDAEIQYVDRNLNLPTVQENGNQVNQPVESGTNYEQQSSSSDMMKASGSETHSILIDRRSIADGRMSNSSAIVKPHSDNRNGLGKKSKLSQAVKKIISIRNSRQVLKENKATTKAITKKNAQLPTVSPLPTTISIPTSTNQTNIPKLMLGEGNNQKQNKLSFVGKKKTETIVEKKLLKQRNGRKTEEIPPATMRPERGS